MTGETLYSDDNTYTLNSLKSILQCNRLTAEKYITKGNYKKTSKNYNGKEFNAWIIPPNEIDRLKNNLSYTALPHDVTLKTSVIKSVPMNDNVTPVQPSATTELLRNITELNGRITALENDNKALTKEIKDLTSENTVLAREKAIVDSKILLIEDKRSLVEGENSRLNQELKAVTTLKNKLNYAVIGLSGIILVMLTALTMFFILKH